MTTRSGPTCRTCRFFADFGPQHSGRGECRKRPPALGGATVVSSNPGARGWPAVDGGRDWCGEHAPREARHG